GPVEGCEPGAGDGRAEAIARSWHAKTPRHDPQQEAQGRANAESRGRACGEKLVHILAIAGARFRLDC
ncbi:MAG: hypothetical protein ACO38W_03450, partial [Phycisphaerales bacterium]